MSERAGRVEIVPCTLRWARTYILVHHRHHPPPQGGLFACAASVRGRICGVAIVGKPVARMLDDGRTAEVTRLATDGTRNACSALYAACWRAARALGYRRMVTYTMPHESGTSLLAAGWKLTGVTEGGGWGRPSRKRVDKHPVGPKIRWEVDCAG